MSPRSVTVKGHSRRNSSSPSGLSFCSMRTSVIARTPSRMARSRICVIRARFSRRCASTARVTDVTPPWPSTSLVQLDVGTVRAHAHLRRDVAEQAG